MPNIIRQINTDDDYGTQKIRMIVQSNERGPAGPKGDTGEAATIAAGQAYSVEPGQSPAVMNTGTSSAAVFDFYIPKGEKGEKGDQGDPGPAGADEWGEIIGNIADQTDLQNALNGKQNKLTAGSNITIAGDTISATNTTYTAGNGLSLNHGEFSVNTGTIQSKLTAGSNVQINGSTISATDTTYSAGNAITIDSGNNNAINAAIDPADFFTSTENKLTGTGTSVTLTPTAGLPLDSVQLDGDTTQQTYSGKNLYLPIPKTSQDQGLILSYDSTTGECTISGTTTNTWSNFTSSQTCDLPAGTYTFSTSNPTTEKINFILQASLEGGGSESFNLGRDGTASLTKTINSKITSLRIWAGADSGKQINWAGTFQLESGSSSTSFEPYVGGIPAPNPDYPQEVQVVTGEQTVTITDGAEESQEYEVNLGKNLFDVSSITENTSPSFTGGKGHVVTFSANNDRAVILIKVEPNTSYTLSIGDTSIVNQIFIVGMQNTYRTIGQSQ